MLVRLLPIAIALMAVFILLLARRAGKARNAALFAAAGIADAPSGPRARLGGTQRETKVVDGVLVALGMVTQRKPAPVTVVGTHRPHEDRTTIKKHLTTRSLHLWIVYPQPFPQAFRLAAGPEEHPAFEGDFPDMAELLAAEPASARAQALLAMLAPLGGALNMDEHSIELSLPAERAPDAPLPGLLRAALDFWCAVRDGSEYPYSA